MAGVNRHIFNRTIRVTKSDACGHPIHELIRTQGWDVVFGRVRQGDDLGLVHGWTEFCPGDLVTIVGAQEDLERVTAFLGEESSEHLELDRSELDYRRIIVSNPKVAGHQLRDLNLPQQYGAVVTRVRRGDVEFLPHGDTVLDLGDRIRVLTSRNNLDAVSSFFGDSYRAVSEIDILSFGVGLALGLLVGLIPIPLPGGTTLRLGFAGGPLIVALILGYVERTGPIVWTLPYNANLTLRQFGLVLFLAGIGTRSGWAFVTTFSQAGGPGDLCGRRIDHLRDGVCHAVRGLQTVEDSDEHHDRDFVRPTHAAGGVGLCAGAVTQRIAEHRLCDGLSLWRRLRRLSWRSCC